MNFKTQAGHWRFAAARFPNAVHFRIEPTYLRDDDYSWIYSWECIALEMVLAAQETDVPAAILIHGNPTLPPGTISLRAIIRDSIRDEYVWPRFRVAEFIECDEALIVVFRPRAAHRAHTG